MIYDNLRPQSQDQIVWSSAENLTLFIQKHHSYPSHSILYMTCIPQLHLGILRKPVYQNREVRKTHTMLCTLNACGATPFEWDSSKVCCLLAALYLQSTVSRLKQQPLFCNLFSLEFAVLMVKSVNAFENISVTLWRSSHPAWLGFTEEDAIETAWSRTAGRFKNVSEISKIWVLHFHCVG